MKKIYLKKRKKHTIKTKIIFILIILITITSLIIKIMNKNISPKLRDYAEIELKKISKLIITKSIKKDQLEKLNINDIFIITKNENNEIITVDFNTLILNKMILEITETLQENLKKLEMGTIDDNNEENKNGVVLKIPLGEIYNNFMLSDLGPKIPVKLKILGDLETKVNTQIKDYGINSAIIEISLDITVKEKVILPLTTKEIKVTQTIPLAIKLVQGKIPNYYSDGINKSSEFTIPIE